jgi:uncharacterized protein (DUF2141 family)
MKFKNLLAITSLVLVSCYARANNNNNTTSGVGDECKKTDIAGGVFQSETKKPLSNVSVTAYHANKKEKIVATDANGNFSFDDLTPGTYKFVFEKPGYKKVTKEKTIVRIDEGLDLSVMMEEHVSYDFTPGPAQFYNFE